MIIWESWHICNKIALEFKTISLGSSILIPVGFSLYLVVALTNL